MDGLFPYVPSLFSIALIGLSIFFADQVRALVRHYETEDASLQRLVHEHHDVVADIAVDWGERVGLINAAIVAMGSAFAIYDVSGNVEWTLGSLAVLIIACIGLILWMNGKNAGELVEATTEIPLTRLTFRYVNIIRFSIFVINVFLIVAIHETG